MKKFKIKNTILVTVLSGMLLGGPVFANESLMALQKESQVSKQISVKISQKDIRVSERDFSSSKKMKKFAIDEIIVKFKGDQKPFRIIKVSKGKVLEEVEKYKKRDDVIYAEPNFVVRALMEPNDNYYKYQWHLDNLSGSGVNAEEAWDISDGSGAVVAVIDTGVAYENYKRYVQAPDLANTCFVEGYDFVNNDIHPNDDNSHGTHVAGTIAQSTNNNLGVAGLAYSACLMPVKVLDRNGEGFVDDVAEGIIFAADHGAQVINLSLGGNEPSETLENALAHAYNKEVTIVAAAGNNSSDNSFYPAAYNDYVIAVGATRYDKTLSYYSNYGPDLDLVAPGGQLYIEGTDIMFDQNDDDYWDGVLQQTFDPVSKNVRDFSYYFFQGTSMAAPHVAGAAALLIANGNAVTPDEVRTALQNTAQDLGTTGRDDIYGHGLIDAFAALQYLIETERFGFFDDEISQENTCAAGVLDFYLNPSETGIVLVGELINIDINNKDGNLPFEYQVRVETSEDVFCDNLDVSVVMDGLGYYSGKLKDFSIMATISNFQDNWEFTITDFNNNIPGQTCDFEFIFEGWQEGLNFEQGFTDREFVLGTVKSLVGSQTQEEEIFPPDVLIETSLNKIVTDNYDEEETGDAAIEEDLEDDMNDDADSEDKSENEDSPETSSDIKDEEKIVAPKQEDLPDDDDLDDEKNKKEEGEDEDEDEDEDKDDSDDDSSNNELNKNSVDCVQAV